MTTIGSIDNQPKTEWQGGLPYLVASFTTNSSGSFATGRVWRHQLIDTSNNVDESVLWTDEDLRDALYNACNEVGQGCVLRTPTELLNPKQASLAEDFGASSPNLTGSEETDVSAPTSLLTSEKCNHEFIIDWIDIDPDKSQQIVYCKYCYLEDKMSKIDS